MVELFNAFVNNVKETMRYYQTIQELSALSDMELQDLGMSRLDIVAVANKTYFRKYN